MNRTKPTDTAPTSDRNKKPIPAAAERALSEAAARRATRGKLPFL